MAKHVGSKYPPEQLPNTLKTDGAPVSMLLVPGLAVTRSDRTFTEMKPYPSCLSLSS